MSTQTYEHSPNEQAVMMELDGHQWHTRMNALMAQDARIIAFRGAGTVNGIDPTEAEAATTLLTDYVSNIAKDGTTVAIVFDGDEDNRQKPDVGSIFGGIADAMKNVPNVVAITAQTKGWYYPKTEGGVLESATGTPYETYVFPDELPGSHSALTQSEALASYRGYEQIFVGPAGPIAFNQLKDVNGKAQGRSSEVGPLKVSIVETSINAELSEGLRQQLEAAGDDTARAKIAAKIDQREAQPYGALFTKEGQFAVDQNEYSNLAFQVGKALAQ